LFGVAVLAAAYTFPGVIGGALVGLVFAGWIFFAIRDRRRKRST
jgi:hypothetical protein